MCKLLLEKIPYDQEELSWPKYVRDFPERPTRYTLYRIGEDEERAQKLFFLGPDDLVENPDLVKIHLNFRRNESRYALYSITKGAEQTICASATMYLGGGSRHNSQRASVWIPSLCLLPKEPRQIIVTQRRQNDDVEYVFTQTEPYVFYTVIYPNGDKEISSYHGRRFMGRP